MDLQTILGVLSKSSPYSVSTLRKGKPDELLKIKNYLYVPPPIEHDLEQALSQSIDGDLYFLCGSSGDGKSEILTNLYDEFQKTIDFHLDATHSKGQHSSAVDCLNDLFDAFKVNRRPLAVGINIGMMQKFIKQGDDRHNDIKSLLKSFFENRHQKGFKIGCARFFDFECYPRIDFTNNKITSEFVFDFLTKLTKNSSNNPFWRAYIKEKKVNGIIASNYELISIPAFKNSLIELFGLARLYDEQFLTPRAFVDFIYQIITLNNPDGLIGNLFSEFDNEISHKLAKLDPNAHRCEGIDDFYLGLSTNTLDNELTCYVRYLNQTAGVELTPKGLIRLAFLLRKDEKNQSLPSNFVDAFKHYKRKDYLQLINIYSKETISSNDEDTLLNIIEDTFVSAIYKYANRHLHKELAGYIVSREVNDYFVCNKVDIQVDLDWVESHKLKTAVSLPIPLIINNKEPIIFNLDINLLSLASDIHDGFLPNRQSQGELAKFNELVSEIVNSVNNSNELKVIYKNSSKERTIDVSKIGRRYSVKGWA